jgi:hypothetical protein
MTYPTPVNRIVVQETKKLRTAAEPMVGGGADECEHLRELPEPDEFEIILGLRRLIQIYRFCCGLEYNPVDCPLRARCCNFKIECDNNDMDLGSIGMLELGTRDVKVIFESDDEDDGGDEDFGEISI